MVATHIKKIKHSLHCVITVYIGDITNTIFVILHSDVSCLSVCSSCTIAIEHVSNFLSLFLSLSLCLPLQLTDVEKGGNTVFLKSGISVAPIKVHCLFVLCVHWLSW